MMIIGLKGIKIKAPIGLYEWEKKKGRKFRIDVEIKVDIEEKEIQDDIQNTINYEDIFLIIKECLLQEFDLIETAVFAVSQKIYTTFPNIKEMKVRIEKLKPLPAESMKSAFVERIFTQP